MAERKHFLVCMRFSYECEEIVEAGSQEEALNAATKTFAGEHNVGDGIIEVTHVSEYKVNDPFLEVSVYA